MELEWKRDRTEMQYEKRPELKLDVAMTVPLLGHCLSFPLPQWKTRIPPTETDSLNDLLPTQQYSEERNVFSIKQRAVLNTDSLCEVDK